MSPPSLLTEQIPAAPLDSGHSDYVVVKAICDEIEKRSKGWKRFGEEIPRRLRLAMDEVIDTPRTGRFTLDQTEPTEKTYVGTKVEILIRDFLGFPKGLLDLEINGVDVDVKNTVGTGWMIPTEAVGKPCIVVQENEKTARCSVGVIVCNPPYLTGGANKDGKVSISAVGRKHIHWLLKDHAYPKNVWEDVAPSVLKHIVEPEAGGERLARLFLAFLGKTISRTTVEAIARQKDPMKRVRNNGGARDFLEPEGIAILSATFDKKLAASAFGIALAKGEFVACPVKTPAQLRAVQASGKHPGLTRLAD